MKGSKVIKSLGGHGGDLRGVGDLLFRCLVVVILVLEVEGGNMGDFSVVFDEDCLNVFRK